MKSIPSCWYSEHSMIRGIKFDRIDCVFCEGEVARTEKGRPITLEECGSAQLFDKIRALIVADAICLACRAKYLAWIDARAVVDGNAVPYPRTDDTIMALSFRSTFSDEPGPDDMPEFSVVWRPELTPLAAMRAVRQASRERRGARIRRSDERRVLRRRVQ